MRMFWLCGVSDPLCLTLMCSQPAGLHFGLMRACDRLDLLTDFAPLYRLDTVMGMESQPNLDPALPPSGLCNAVILAKPYSSFISACDASRRLRLEASTCESVQLELIELYSGVVAQHGGSTATARLTRRSGRNTA